MIQERDSRTRFAPIFIFADSDREANERLFERLHDEFCYIPVHNPNLVVRYAKRFATTAVFLAAPLEYPCGGAAALLQRLLDDVGKPVVILLEDWSPKEAERWKRMGAVDCIPHPTRTLVRMEKLRLEMQKIVLSAPSHDEGCDSLGSSQLGFSTTYFAM